MLKKQVSHGRVNLSIDKSSVRMSMYSKLNYFFDSLYVVRMFGTNRCINSIIISQER